MEASQAALSQGDAADGGQAQDQQQTQEQQDAQQQQATPLPQELVDQLGTVPQQLEQMREWMEAQQQQQVAAEAEPGEDPQPVDLSFVDPADPSYDPQRAASMLLEQIQAQNAQAVQQAVAPLQEQIAEQRAEREADHLAKEFPELENEETANAVFKAAQDWVQAAGLPPEAAGNMQVVRAVYMMGRAAELHNSEQQSEQQTAASLEGAGGASPGGSQQGLTAESIVGEGPRRVLPFG